MTNFGKAIATWTSARASARLSSSASSARHARLARQLACAALAAILLLALVGCATQGTDSSPKSASDDQATDDVSTAIVAYASGDDVLFVDEDTQAPYFPTLPEGAVFGLYGQPIAVSELAAGNIVSVAGDGIMLESYPAQYPGITDVRVTSEGDPADAAQYADIVAAVFAEPDASVAPTGSLEYRTDLAVVSLVLDSFGSEWTHNGETVSVDGWFADADGAVLADTPDARISSSTECAAAFPLALEEVTVERMRLSAGPDGVRAVSASEGETVACSPKDGAASFMMDPGYAYVLTAQFADGEASYAFIAVRPGE